ncbi:ribosomal protein S5 domain 2-type protein [Paraphysoderma sedebokerense]|nr:ribosomal protein S5 domain 2-type protein [Paraphysoderma sedebokerense]
MISRPDKRTIGQIRPMACSQGLLNRADGSSRFNLDKTSVICSVYGPTEVKLKNEQLDRATIEVNVKPSVGLSTTQERHLENTLRMSLEDVILSVLHPRTSIQITFQIMWDDGSVLAACMNAAMLALIDAGVPLKATFGAISIAIAGNGQIMLDPLKSEMETADSIHTYMFDSISSDAYSTRSIGTFTEEEFNQCYDLAVLAIPKIIGFLRTAIEKKLEKEVQLKI